MIPPIISKTRQAAANQLCVRTARGIYCGVSKSDHRFVNSPPSLQ